MSNIEIAKFTPEEIDETIESLDALQEIIVPFLKKQNYEGMGKQDVNDFKKHIMMAKHALIMMGRFMESRN